MLFIPCLAATIEVAFPEDSRYRKEMGVKLEVAGGDITDVRRFRRLTIIRILDCIYADDTTLVSDYFGDMQEMIQQFAQTATKFGLLINMQKTMPTYDQADEKDPSGRPFCVGDHPLQDVSSFPYLGSIITPDNDTTEFTVQIGWARGVFFKLARRLWNQWGTQKGTKTRVFNAVVTFTILYRYQAAQECSVQASTPHFGSKANGLCPNDTGI